MATASIPDPFETPEAFDKFTLDGTLSPGLSTITSGGNRKTKIEQKQTKQSEGAYTQVQGDEMSGVTYDLIVWAPDQIRELRGFVEALKAGKKLKPPKTWRLTDPRIDHNDINEVIVGNIGDFKRIGPTKWSISIEFAEFKKRKPSGGSPKPKSPQAKTELEKKIEAQAAENRALEAELRAAQAGA